MAFNAMGAVQGLQGAYPSNNPTDLMSRGMDSWLHQMPENSWYDGSPAGYGGAGPAAPTTVLENPKWSGYLQSLQDQGVSKLSTSAATRGMEPPTSQNPFGSQAGFFDTQGALQGLQGYQGLNPYEQGIMTKGKQASNMVNDTLNTQYGGEGAPANMKINPYKPGGA